MAISMITFGLADYIDNYYGFLIVCFISRIMQGFASSNIQTTCFSISGQLYKEHQALVIGYLEMSCGIGLTCGPVVGSILYDIGGYLTPFIVFGSMFGIFGFFLKVIIPKKIDIRVHEIIDKLDDD